ncbi:MAG: 3-isopropylmalate dehydratase large subunit [Acidimicrobiaceae bacterium]|nr:3-isopropylmalate dehydratase large subunit [Acidimicrobiaceae bacterium]
MGRTLVEKIWAEHVVEEIDEGLDLLHVDRHYVHDVTSPKAFEMLVERDADVLNPDLTFGSPEHSVTVLSGRTEASNPMSEMFVPLMRRNFANHGLTLFDLDSAEHGIVHVIGPELGLTLPGATVVCGDSHTCTNGGLGALGFGIGTSEVAHVLATQSLVQRRPSGMRIRFEGLLADHVVPKDLILHTIARLGADAGAGRAVEFCGSLVDSLDVEARMTLCNLAVELGTKIGVVAPDDVTYEYLASRRYAPKGSAFDAAVEHWRSLPTDADAAFQRDESIDAAEVAPQITWGTSPAHSIAVDSTVPELSEAPNAETRRQWEQAMEYIGIEPGQRMEGVPIQWVFIGSCTNGRLSDLRAAAAAIAGRQVSPGVRALVVPGSAAVHRAAEAEGLDRVFVDAGFEWGEAGCGLCPGLGGVHLAPGDRCVSTSNRNFMSRQGKDVRTHLASPATAAIAAVAGCITDVRSAA